MSVQEIGAPPAAVPAGVEERYAVISVDGHCGADLLDYRPYLEQRFHEDFDAWASAYSLRYGDVVSAGKDVDRNWNHERRLAETAEDGVVAEVLYPNTYPPFNDMGPLSTQPPADRDGYERIWAGYRAHNRWLADFCAAAPGRRAGVALVLLNEPEAAVEEIRWAHEHGLTGGILLPGVAPGAAIPPLHSRKYDPVWAVCEDLGMPLNHHPDSAAPPIVLEPVHLAIHVVEVKWFMHRALWHLIFGGAFERFHGLTLVLAEQGADWIPRTLQTLDYYHERFALRASQESMFGASDLTPLRSKPSEYWATNCYVGATFMRPTEVRQRYEIGVDRIMWGQDYPHPESTFPHSHAALRHTFHDVPVDEVRKMVSSTAAQVFGFDLGALAPLAAEFGPSVAQTATALDRIPEGATCPAFADVDYARAW